MRRSEMKAAAKFRAVCECGAKSPRFATDTTTNYWMRNHEGVHRAQTVTEDPEVKN